VRRCGEDASGTGWGSAAAPYERGNEPPVSIKEGEFL